MRILAVGDIHTKLWIIDEVEKLLADYDKVVFVGDYADDWMATSGDSIATWRKLMELQKDNEDKVIIMSGNHDFIYLKHVHEYQSGFNDSTKMMLSLPENAKLENWLASLPYVKEVDGVLYSHAGVTSFWYGKFGIKTNYTYVSPEILWRNDSPLWARPSEFQHHYLSQPQVFGHTPSDTCWEVEPNVWCIDTFSTYPDGTSVGDQTVLEIINGVEFNKIKLEIKNDNDNTSSVERRLS